MAIPFVNDRHTAATRNGPHYSHSPRTRKDWQCSRLAPRDENSLAEREDYTTTSSGSLGCKCSSEPNFNSCGNHAATAGTESSDITPPKTTEGTSPISFAATPDSNSPSSLLEPMKITLTAVTRP